MEKKDKPASTTGLNKRAQSVRWHTSCGIKWYTRQDINTHTQNSKIAGQTSQVSVMLMTWKMRLRFDWMRGQALRGLRAPDCASNFTSCDSRWWALFFLSCSFAFSHSFPSSVPLLFVCSSSSAAIIICQCEARSNTYTLPNLSHGIRDPDAQIQKSIAPNKNKK